MSQLRTVFENIMALNRWSGDESRSGPGSTLAYTTTLRSQLPTFLEQFGVQVFLDAPCGDFHWMKEVGFPADVKYIGGDIASSLIAANVEKYASPSREFIEFDIAVDSFPPCDVWFCRDCLFHLPNETIFRALRNFCGSGIRLLMMTNHLNTTAFRNIDIEAGEFRLLDFHSEPFHLPREALLRVTDYVHPFPPRELCVWTREQVAAALERRGERPLSAPPTAVDAVTFDASCATTGPAKDDAPVQAEKCRSTRDFDDFGFELAELFPYAGRAKARRAPQ